MVARLAAYPLDISLRLTVAIWNAPNYCTRVERDAPMVAQAAPWFRSTGVRVAARPLALLLQALPSFANGESKQREAARSSRSVVAAVP